MSHTAYKYPFYLSHTHGVQISILLITNAGYKSPFCFTLMACKSSFCLSHTRRANLYSAYYTHGVLIPIITHRGVQISILLHTHCVQISIMLITHTLHTNLHYHTRRTNLHSAYHTRRTNLYSAYHTHGVQIFTLLTTNTALKSPPCLPHPRSAYFHSAYHKHGVEISILLTTPTECIFSLCLPQTRRRNLHSAYTHGAQISILLITHKRCTNHTRACHIHGVHIFTLLSTHMAYKLPLCLYTPGVSACESQLFLPLYFTVHTAHI
jgi:hypothetical protein